MPTQPTPDMPLALRNFLSGKTVKPSEIVELVEMEGGAAAVKNKYGLSATEYHRLRKQADEAGFRTRGAEVPPEKSYERAEKDAKRTYWESIWEQNHAVAMEFFVGNAARIIELGFTAKDQKGNVIPDIKGFLDKAMEFFMEHGQDVQAMELQLKAMESFKKHYLRPTLEATNSAIRTALLMINEVGEQNPDMKIVLFPIAKKLSEVV